MTNQPGTGGGLMVLAPFAVALVTTCLANSNLRPLVQHPMAPTDNAGSTKESESWASIRFAVEVRSDETRPVYILLNSEDDQPGWVKAFRDGQRIYFRERCEIEDCGVSSAVCGAAIPFVRKLVPGTSMEFIWDGMTSALDPVSGCETRRPAAPGHYTASFCFARAVEVVRGGDPDTAALARLVKPSCMEKPFSLLQEDVVFAVPEEPR
jgi:hypothetical protein